jgi:uncharacterized protein (TIGR02646 family)
MHRLPNTQLEKKDVDALAQRQAYVDGGADFADTVERAKTKFGSKPKALFTRVRKRLSEMSGDLVRCAYCEDSCADEVEHVRPKDFYPEVVFDWANYLFACGPCNGGKNNKSRVWTDLGSVIDLRDHRTANGVVPPPAGISLFVDPRGEDPLEYLFLDIIGGTFRFAVYDETDASKIARAEATRDFLDLNRDVLVAARRNAFGGYRDRLAQYVADKAAGAVVTALEQRIADLKITPHRTVWLEMKRQHKTLPLIAPFFDQAPEALEW